MADGRRSNWLLFPVTFGLTFFAAQWLYFLPERQAWIQAHGGDSSWAAFGEGELMGASLFAAVGPSLIALLVILLRSPVRMRDAGAIGVAVGVWMFALGTLAYVFVGAGSSGALVSFLYDFVLPGAIVAGFHWFRARREPTDIAA